MKTLRVNTHYLHIACGLLRSWSRKPRWPVWNAKATSDSVVQLFNLFFIFIKKISTYEKITWRLIYQFVHCLCFGTNKCQRENGFAHTFKGNLIFNNNESEMTYYAIRSRISGLPPLLVNFHLLSNRSFSLWLKLVDWSRRCLNGSFHFSETNFRTLYRGGTPKEKNSQSFDSSFAWFARWFISRMRVLLSSLVSCFFVFIFVSNLVWSFLFAVFFCFVMVWFGSKNRKIDYPAKLVEFGGYLELKSFARLVCKRQWSVLLIVRVIIVGQLKRLRRSVCLVWAIYCCWGSLIYLT